MCCTVLLTQIVESGVTYRNSTQNGTRNNAAVCPFRPVLRDESMRLCVSLLGERGAALPISFQSINLFPLAQPSNRSTDRPAALLTQQHVLQDPSLESTWLRVAAYFCQGPAGLRQCTMPVLPAGHTCVWRLGAAGLMLGVALLAAPASSAGAVSHQAFAVSPWMAESFVLVWRAGACSHDCLALQTALIVAWGAAALQFWAAHMAQLMRVRAGLMLPPLACSTGQLMPATTFPTSPGTCSESVRFTLALCSMSVVVTKLMSFSLEAPRPTAANAQALV